ncbi:MAG: DUF5665 domain-containing protein [Candidatus Paceibacterota bacterium]
MEKELVEQLKTLEKELKSIHAAVEKSYLRVFVTGLVYGGGIALGTVFAIALAGWLLSIFGVIPGIGDIADTLQTVIENDS